MPGPGDASRHVLWPAGRGAGPCLEAWKSHGKHGKVSLDDDGSGMCYLLWQFDYRFVALRALKHFVSFRVTLCVPALFYFFFRSGIVLLHSKTLFVPVKYSISMHTHTQLHTLAGGYGRSCEVVSNC